MQVSPEEVNTEEGINNVLFLAIATSGMLTANGVSAMDAF